MILVDERTGSKEFLQILRTLGCQAEISTLDAADFAFTGNGDPLICPQPLVGLERKTIDEIINSISDRRLAGFQQIKMARTYDEAYLIIEGLWRRGKDGRVEVLEGKGHWVAARSSITYSQIDGFLTSLEIQGGLRLWRTASFEETAAAIADRYHWWSKPWESHNTLKTIYTKEVNAGRRNKPSILRKEATLAQEWASRLPFIDSKALAVGDHFKSALALAVANETEWMKIDGIGAGIASAAVKAIRQVVE